MTDFKAVIAHTKLGRCVQKDVTGDKGDALLGKKIGDSIDGNLLGFEGYTFQLTGGSDKAGFPMRWDVQGTGKKKILVVDDEELLTKTFTRLLEKSGYEVYVAKNAQHAL